MRWSYSLQQKTKITFWSALILILIFVKNWIDKSNVTTLDTTFSSVYEDRLMAESYIFRLSEQLYQKELLLSSEGTLHKSTLLSNHLSQHNNSINSLILDYEKTQLTDEESFYFKQLKLNLDALERLEKPFIQSLENSREEINGIPTQMEEQFKSASYHLNKLSKIQITEGKLLKDQSSRIVAGSTLLSQFELVVIVGLGILIQVLIFASRSTVPKTPQRYQLN